MVRLWPDRVLLIQSKYQYGNEYILKQYYNNQCILDENETVNINHSFCCANMALLTDLVSYREGTTSFGDLLLLVDTFSEVTRKGETNYYTLWKTLYRFWQSVK